MADIHVAMPRDFRDVLADRIIKWAGEAGVYNYVDRLIADLDTAGWEITPRVCPAVGCDEEMFPACEVHGPLSYGLQHGRLGAHMVTPNCRCGHPLCGPSAASACQEPAERDVVTYGYAGMSGGDPSGFQRRYEGHEL